VTEKRQCPKCGAELSAGAAQGLCPKCLLDAGLQSHAASGADEAATGPFVTPSHAAAATIPKPERFAAPGLEMLAGQFPQLDHFEHLGRGGMGVVYKARQRNLNRPVAVKILPPSSGADPAFAERFTREAQALARLNHPNIVQVHDFGRTEDHFYFVMEYVDGVNLRALIRDGNLKPEEALKIVPQICEALQFAHDEGIVHRDIKPENILLDKKGRVKIADFGLAKLLGHAADDLSLTGTGQLMGTLGYMAPEQLQQAHRVDHRADIYSLGVVFYEMLTGQLPIGRFQPPSKKVQVDVRLDEIVLRSLETEPDRRYQHASDVKTDLASMSSITTPADRYSSNEPSWQRFARCAGQSIADHPVLWSLAVFLTLPILVMLAPLIGFGPASGTADPGSHQNPQENFTITLVILGPCAFLAWAYVWRVSVRGINKPRTSSAGTLPPGAGVASESSARAAAESALVAAAASAVDPKTEGGVTSRTGHSIANHPVLWTIAVFLTFGAIAAPIGALLFGYVEAGRPALMLGPAIGYLFMLAPLAFLAWAYLWRAAHRPADTDRERREPLRRRLARALPRIRSFGR
jgi:serine/threonine protein kinase